MDLILDVNTWLYTMELGERRRCCGSRAPTCGPDGGGAGRGATIAISSARCARGSARGSAQSRGDGSLPLKAEKARRHTGERERVSATLALQKYVEDVFLFSLVAKDWSLRGSGVVWNG